MVAIGCPGIRSSERIAPSLRQTALRPRKARDDSSIGKGMGSVRREPDVTPVGILVAHCHLVGVRTHATGNLIRDSAMDEATDSLVLSHLVPASGFSRML